MKRKPTPDMSNLPGRLTELRYAAGLSLADLAAQADTSPSSISEVERGLRTPSLPVLVRLARVLGVGLDDLLSTPPGDVERVGQGRPRRER